MYNKYLHEPLIITHRYLQHNLMEPTLPYILNQQPHLPKHINLTYQPTNYQKEITQEIPYNKNKRLLEIINILFKI